MKKFVILMMFLFISISNVAFARDLLVKFQVNRSKLNGTKGQAYTCRITAYTDGDGYVTKSILLEGNGSKRYGTKLKLNVNETRVKPEHFIMVECFKTGGVNKQPKLINSTSNRLVANIERNSIERATTELLNKGNFSNDLQRVVKEYVALDRKGDYEFKRLAEVTPKARIFSFIDGEPENQGYLCKLDLRYFVYDFGPPYHTNSPRQIVYTIDKNKITVDDKQGL